MATSRRRLSCRPSLETVSARLRILDCRTIEWKNDELPCNGFEKQRQARLREGFHRACNIARAAAVTCPRVTRLIFMQAAFTMMALVLLTFHLPTSAFTLSGALPYKCAGFCLACAPWCCDNTDCVGCIKGCNRPPWPPPRTPDPPKPPAPPAPPPDRAEYWTSGRRLMTNAFNTDGQPLRLKGVSWFGLESMPCYIGGGHAAPLAANARFLHANGFNAVRVPLAVDEIVRSAPGVKPRCGIDGIYIEHNPSLVEASF